MARRQCDGFIHEDGQQAQRETGKTEAKRKQEIQLKRNRISMNAKQHYSVHRGHYAPVALYYNTQIKSCPQKEADYWHPFAGSITV